MRTRGPLQGRLDPRTTDPAPLRELGGRRHAAKRARNGSATSLRHKEVRLVPAGGTGPVGGCPAYPPGNRRTLHREPANMARSRPAHTAHTEPDGERPLLHHAKAARRAGRSVRDRSVPAARPAAQYGEDVRRAGRRQGRSSPCRRAAVPPGPVPPFDRPHRDLQVTGDHSVAVPTFEPLGGTKPHPLPVLLSLGSEPAPLRLSHPDVVPQGSRPVSTNDKASST